jgi:hypothetical protein
MNTARFSAWVARLVAFARRLPLVIAIGCFLTSSAPAQLFQNLQSLTQSIPVGSGETDPVSGKRLDGPRWVCTADFDLDGNQDFATCHLNGEIFVGWGRGDGSFEGPELVASGVSDLRAIITGDFNGDGRPDLAAAAPYDGVVTLLFSRAPRGFAAPSLVPTFKRGRNLVGGDFDGDGILDLAVAGPDEWVNPLDPKDTNQIVTGVMHLRGTGGGAFVKMGTVPEIGLPNLNDSKLKPVFSLQSFRRPGEVKDTLAVTHEHSPAIWLLQPGTNGVLQISDTLSWFGNTAQVDGASPYLVDSLKIGTLFAPAESGQMDLIAVMQEL